MTALTTYWHPKSAGELEAFAELRHLASVGTTNSKASGDIHVSKHPRTRGTRPSHSRAGKNLNQFLSQLNHR